MPCTGRVPAVDPTKPHYSATRMDFSMAAAGGGLVVIEHFAKSPQPDAQAKCSAWAKCLERSRATAIKPDGN